MTVASGPGRTPGQKLLFTLLVAALLFFSLFAVYLLVYDRQTQSATAQVTIAEGWGGPQTLAGPVLVIPYQEQVVETVTEAGRQVTRGRTVWRELTLSPEVADLATEVAPERRRRSIYEAVVYEATMSGTSRFALPADLVRFGVTADRLAYDRAELRFGLSDARGLFGRPPSARVDGRALVLQPGKGPPATAGSGFFAWLDARTLLQRPLGVRFRFAFRGNGSLTLAPQAGDTRWQVRSRWPHPSFGGGFLPTERRVTDGGFSATWRVGNLALGRALVEAGEAQATATAMRVDTANPAGEHEARVDLVSPVDLYSQSTGR